MQIYKLIIHVIACFHMHVFACINYISHPLYMYMHVFHMCMHVPIMYR